MITGGSGAGIQHYNPSWVREVCDHRVEAGIAHFHEQWGGRRLKAGGRIPDGRTRDQLPHLDQSHEQTLPLW